MPLWVLGGNIPLITSAVNFVGRSWLHLAGTTVAVGAATTAVVKHKALGDAFCNARVEHATAPLKLEVATQKQLNIELNRELDLAKSAKTEAAEAAKRIGELEAKNAILAQEAAKVEAAAKSENEARQKVLDAQRQLQEAQQKLAESRAREDNLRQKAGSSLLVDEHEAPRESNAAPLRKRQHPPRAKGGKAVASGASARTARRKPRGSQRASAR